MKTIFITTVLLIVCATNYCQVTDYAWARQGNTGGGHIAGISIAPMPSQGCISTGNMSFSVNFDSLWATGYGDPYLVYHDSSGAVVWLKALGGGSQVLSKCLTTDHFGNCYLAGNMTGYSVFSDTITLHKSVDPNSMFVGDGFIFKFDSSGHTVMGIKADTSGSNGITGLVTDNAGNIFITGSFRDYIVFDNFSLSATGPNDIFIAGFRPSGECFILKQIGDSAFAVSTSISVSNFGEIAISGYFFGDSLATETTTLLNLNPGYQDAFLVVMDTSGTELFTKQIQGMGEDWGWDICFDATGNLWLLDESSSDITIDGTAIPIWGRTAVWVKFNSSGTLQCHNEASSGSVWPKAIATDAIGNIYLSGRFSGFTIVADTFVVANGGGSSVFYVVADSLGAVLDMKSISNGDNITADEICVNSNNDFFFTGGFLGYNSFVIGTDTLASNTLPGVYYDPYLVKVRGPYSSTGIAENEPGEMPWISLYPNPVSGTSLQLALAEELKYATLDIYDMRGRHTAHHPTDNSLLRNIDISALAPGIYTLKMTTAKQVVAKRFIKIAGE